MTNNTALARSMIVYAVCLPLAIVLGYLITDPLDKKTDITLGVVMFLLILPLLLRWYHAWLIAIWNMSMLFVFLPGLFPGWIPMACIGFAIAVGHYVLNRERKFLEFGAVSWSLICLGLVVFITAEFRGGIGFRALGDESVGGKRYLWIWVAIVGYFALVSQRVPTQKRRLYTTLFLLAAATQIINQFGSSWGPLSGFINLFFPGRATLSQFSTDPMGPANLERFAGFANACIAVAFAVVARYGIAGTLNVRNVWRPFVFFAAVLLSATGGFRLMVITITVTLGLVYYFEGLLRSRLTPIVVLGMILMGGLIVSFSDRLPLPTQRCLAFLPLKIDPVARMSAEGSSDWRLEIWESMIPQIPHYLWLGKGLAIDANDMAMYVTLGNQQVGGEIGGSSTLAGDYHNGPLSVIIPFGIWGCIAFFWFLWASLKVLWANYKYGDPEIRTINTFLLSSFLAKTIIFFLIFGGFVSDLFMFVGLIGFNISLNGGVAKAPVPAPRPQTVSNRFRLLPLERPVTSS